MALRDGVAFASLKGLGGSDTYKRLTRDTQVPPNEERAARYSLCGPFLLTNLFEELITGAVVVLAAPATVCFGIDILENINGSATGFIALLN